ncbi:FixJ family two-component response regulator [Paraburkholderia bannensis]|uniref:FixJ family two-component response regulator n=1 Tax=Paraburkholderia bannensis TaxID=765414 RepID=A0A7W9U143_9BURK|nr:MULTISPECIES: response regulator [Paraburkholderia]MBB3262141.1 FixJ family two-component response regulator [Paraburkholderia sp. WP4_3_2]MBB6105136.1 FixJ family two-component response regulator [Paraburkholderia bannensis]
MSSGPGRLEFVSTVYIVDDDEGIRCSLSHLLLSVGLNVQSFASTAEFRATSLADAPCCLLLDIRLRGESGLAFQQQVADRPDIPIIFITGFADVDICKRAMKGGAFDFLVKPFSDQDVIDAVNGALVIDQRRRERMQTQTALTCAYEQLTRREREVLAYVVSGALNKQIAAWLGVSVITVKLHRAAVMKKMNASSLADLVRKTGALDIQLPVMPES